MATNIDGTAVQPTAPIADYIAEQPEEIRPRLLEVYATLKSMLPEATEKISWKMPTFWQGANIIHFASFKKHIGLFPGARPLLSLQTS